MKMTTAEKVLASLAILVVFALFVIPLVFRDPVANWKVYFSSARQSDFGKMVKRLLKRGEEIQIESASDWARKRDSDTKSDAELRAELSQFLASNGLESLLVKPEVGLVEFGSYRPRRWAVYSYHENGKPPDDRFKSVEIIATNWYYCDW